MSTSAGGEPVRDRSAWTRIATPVALVTAAGGALLAGASHRGPIRAMGLLVALASIGVALAAWAARERADRETGDEDRRARRESAKETDELRDAVAAREAILASLGDGVVLFTPDGRVGHANPAVKELLGRRFETITELVPSSLRAAVREASTGGQPVARELSVADRIVQAVALPHPRRVRSFCWSAT